MKNDSIIKYEEGFFAKLKRKFRSIFMKSNESKVEEISEKQFEIQNSITSEKEQNNEKEKMQNSNLTKEEFFELYKKVINGEVEFSSIDPENMKKINKILEEEVRIKKDILSEKIEILKEKREILKKIVND